MFRTLRHYWYAKSIYRIHSPYVFWWINHCLRTTYPKSNDIQLPSDGTLSQKQRNIAIAHLKATAAANITWFNSTLDINFLSHQATKNRSAKESVLIIKATDLFQLPITYLLPWVHSILVIKNNRRDDKLWEAWIKQAEVPLTLDVLCLGVTIYKKAMARQHFKLL